MKLAVILPAAGVGRRFNAGGEHEPTKIEKELAGKPVFLRALELFLQRPQVKQVLLAVHPTRLDAFDLRWGDKLRFHGVKLIAGGTVERWETVAKALDHVPTDCTHVAVHDAARPMTLPALIDRILDAASRYGAVVPGLPVSNTLKRVEEIQDAASQAGADPLAAILPASAQLAGRLWRVKETVNRSALVEVQTPQVFEAGLLRRAYAQITQGKLDPAGITDDASLVEALGEAVYVVEGDPMNLKITRPQDLELAAAVLEKHESARAAQLAKKRLFADEED
jgi:2-C-methyl-D-erythritol 4-phosphate cytidylyltransferase